MFEKKLPVEPSFIIKDLISSEHFKLNGKLIPLLNGVSFQINKGDKVGVSAFSKEELVCIIEILGNMRPYYKGYVKLSSLGTKAKKGSVVEQIFYLDSPEMLYGDMTLLEHLMYVKNIINIAQDIGVDAGVEQKAILDFIKASQMEKYVLTPIKRMKESTKMVVAIMVALLTTSEKLVINASNYFFSYEEACSIKTLFNMYANKTIVLATFDNKLIGMSCQKVIYLSQGQVKSYTSVKELYKNWDKVTCSIKSGDNTKLVSLIQNLSSHPDFRFFEEDGYIFFEGIRPEDFINKEFFLQCEKDHLIIEKIRINQGRVANAFDEIEGGKKHDIH